MPTADGYLPLPIGEAVESGCRRWGGPAASHLPDARFVEVTLGIWGHPFTSDHRQRLNAGLAQESTLSMARSTSCTPTPQETSTTR
jgi:hypothetical protein